MKNTHLLAKNTDSFLFFFSIGLFQHGLVAPRPTTLTIDVGPLLHEMRLRLSAASVSGLTRACRGLGPRDGLAMSHASALIVTSNIVIEQHYETLWSKDTPRGDESVIPRAHSLFFFS